MFSANIFKEGFTSSQRCTNSISYIYIHKGSKQNNYWFEGLKIHVDSPEVALNIKLHSCTLQISILNMFKYLWLN